MVFSCAQQAMALATSRNLPDATSAYEQHLGLHGSLVSPGNRFVLCVVSRCDSVDVTTIAWYSTGVYGAFASLA